MGLINDDGVISFKKGVILSFSQQNAIGHELDGGVFGQTILKPHFEAHHVTQGRFELFSYSFGHATGRYAPRLGMANPFATLTWRRVQLASSHGEGNFGQLGGFTRSRLATHNDDLMLRQGQGNFVALCRHGQ